VNWDRRMWEEIVGLLSVTVFFVALPVAADVVVLWRLRHAGTDGAHAPTRTVIGYLGLAANVFSMAIVWGSFYYNWWLFNRGAHDIPAESVAGSDRLYDLALILALSSLIFAFMAPKRIRLLLVFASLYVGVTLMMVLASGGIL
jgi:hypothetical protein